MQGYGAWSEPLATSFAPKMSREQELESLKSQADSIKRQLEQIDDRIRELAAEE